MNRALQRRIELLESRVTPPDWQPLKVICKLIAPDYELAPGERIVEDDVIEGGVPAVSVDDRGPPAHHDRSKRSRDTLAVAAEQSR